jgi:hypothetical protein
MDSTYRGWKARAAAQLAKVGKIWPPRIPEHVWRNAYAAGDTPEHAAAVAQAYDREQRPMKLRRNRESWAAAQMKIVVDGSRKTRRGSGLRRVSIVVL